MSIYESYAEKAKTDPDPFCRACYEVLASVGREHENLAFRIRTTANLGGTRIEYIYESHRLEQREIDWLAAMQTYRDLKSNIL